MQVHETVRIRQPRGLPEYRLGTITAITRRDRSSKSIYTVQFPSGTRRLYPAAALTVCSRDDDRAAMTAALVAAYLAMRSAARRALDYDNKLAREITALLTATGKPLTTLDVDLATAFSTRPTTPVKAAKAISRPTRRTHGGSPRHDGAVCGTEDRTGTRITDDLHHVTCPNAAATETVSDETKTGDPHIIDLLREARAGHSREIGGVMIDGTTANAILTVYEASSPRTQKKIAALPITIMSSFAWGDLRSDD